MKKIIVIMIAFLLIMLPFVSYAESGYSPTFPDIDSMSIEEVVLEIKTADSLINEGISYPPNRITELYTGLDDKATAEINNYNRALERQQENANIDVEYQNEVNTLLDNAYQAYSKSTSDGVVTKNEYIYNLLTGDLTNNAAILSSEEVAVKNCVVNYGETIYGLTKPEDGHTVSWNMNEIGSYYYNEEGNATFALDIEMPDTPQPNDPPFSKEKIANLLMVNVGRMDQDKYVAYKETVAMGQEVFEKEIGYVTTALDVAINGKGAYDSAINDITSITLKTDNAQTAARATNVVGQTLSDIGKEMQKIPGLYGSGTMIEATGEGTKAGISGINTIANNFHNSEGLDGYEVKSYNESLHNLLFDDNLVLDDGAATVYTHNISSYPDIKVFERGDIYCFVDKDGNPLKSPSGDLIFTKDEYDLMVENAFNYEIADKEAKGEMADLTAENLCQLTQGNTINIKTKDGWLFADEYNEIDAAEIAGKAKDKIQKQSIDTAINQTVLNLQNEQDKGFFSKLGYKVGIGNITKSDVNDAYQGFLRKKIEEDPEYLVHNNIDKRLHDFNQEINERLINQTPEDLLDELKNYEPGGSGLGSDRAHIAGTDHSREHIAGTAGTDQTAATVSRDRTAGTAGTDRTVGTVSKDRTAATASRDRTAGTAHTGATAGTGTKIKSGRKTRTSGSSSSGSGTGTGTSTGTGTYTGTGTGTGTGSSTITGTATGTGTKIKSGRKTRTSGSSGSGSGGGSGRSGPGGGSGGRSGGSGAGGPGGGAGGRASGKTFRPKFKLPPWTHMPILKPNIYIYPEDTLDINVKFPAAYRLTKTIPEYPKDGWNVNVDKESIIDGMYSYLFYEADIYKSLYQTNYGCIISGDNREEELIEVLDIYGFTENEKKDFIAFWSNRLDEDISYIMYPQDNEIVDKMMPITITPKADSLRRIWFYFVPYNDVSDEVKRCNNIKSIEREGLTVVEWGGSVAD